MPLRLSAFITPLIVLLLSAGISPREAAHAIVRGAPGTVARFFDKPRIDTTPRELEQMARRSALVFGASVKQIAPLRDANPGLRIMYYDQPAGVNSESQDYDFLDGFEAWWVHDDRGSRMRERKGFGPGTWLLNIGHAEMKAYALNKITSTVQQNDYDGVFLDTSNPYWPQFRSWYDVQGNRTTPPDYVLKNWPDWMLLFHTALGPLLGAKTHIFNSWPQTPGRYDEFKVYLEATLDAVDGTQFDGFCYNRGQPWSFDKWRHQLQQARRIIEKRRVVLMKTPLDRMRNDPDKLRSLQTMCFGSYLLVADGEYALFRNVDERDVVRWNERLFTAPVGTPEGPYFTKKALYRRDFSNGTVAVNPTTSGERLHLPRTYYRLNGDPVRSVVLEPRSGIVLLLRPP